MQGNIKTKYAKNQLLKAVLGLRIELKKIRKEMKKLENP